MALPSGFSDLFLLAYPYVRAQHAGESAMAYPQGQRG